MVSEKSKGKLAVVRVRGMVNLKYDIKDTFTYLNLNNKNWCVVLNDTPIIRGMIAKVKDYVTWGEISDETISEMASKRGKETKNENSFDIDDKKYQKFFRLNPPRKGYGRRGVKVPFTNGGALGYRGDKINDLLKRMI